MSLGSGALSLNVVWLRAAHEHGLALPFSESYLTSARSKPCKQILFNITNRSSIVFLLESSKMVVFTGPSQSGKSVAIKHLLQSHSFRTPVRRDSQKFVPFFMQVVTRCFFFFFLSIGSSSVGDAECDVCARGVWLAMELKHRKYSVGSKC